MNYDDVLLLEMDEAFDLLGGFGGELSGEMGRAPTGFHIKKLHFSNDAIFLNFTPPLYRKVVVSC
jgi:hypothetical protein